MPDPIEPQLDELRRRARRRLIGAIVLALTAAVLVPLLLESDPKPLGEDVSVKIPPVDDSKFVSRIGEKAKPVAEGATDAKPVSASRGTDAPSVASPPATEGAAAGPPPSRALAQAEQRVLSPGTKAVPGEAPDVVSSTAVAASGKGAAPSAPAEAGKAAGAAETPKAEAAPKPAEAAKPAEPAKAPDAAVAGEPAKAGAGSYSVQLAAFADDKGANALAAKLKRVGYPAYTEPYETSRGRVWRVRVGPYPTREAAESARDKLKSEGHAGILAAAK